jgi:hypothetical protein
MEVSLVGDLISVNRYRERSDPMPVGNRIKAGDLNRYVVSTGAEVGLYDSFYTATSSFPRYREGTWDEIHLGPPFTVGGPFTSIKATFPNFTVQGAGSYKFHNSYLPAAWNWRYDGGFYDPMWNLAWDSLSDTQYSVSEIIANTMLTPDLSSLGSGAYARLRPSPERAGLGVMLAEARDIPRMLSSTAGTFANRWKEIGGNTRNVRMAPKRAADAFINEQFGWVPFLSDISRMSSVYDETAKHMSQIKHDNARWVRRRRVDKSIESETVIYSRTDITGCQPSGGGYTTNMIIGPKSYTVTLQDYTDVWYEGVFKYYRPEFDDSNEASKGLMGAVSRQMTMYGAHINPVVIWRATPWTWLGDWFSNAGDVVQAAQDWATDSMVSKYMYLMHHRRRRFELKSEFSTCDGQLHKLIWYREADIKRRQAAGSPFDFVLSGSLSPRQLAILIALGISRTP